MLLIYANSALRDTPAKQWDSLGWKMFLLQSAHVDLPEDEKLTAWKIAIDEKHSKWTRKFRDYAKIGGLHANYSEAEAQARESSAFAADRSLWEDIQIKRIEAVDGLLKFFLESNDTFEMDIGDLYSQTAFRRAYSRGTMKILPAIKAPSYEKFISSLEITKVEGMGISLHEKIEEQLAEGARKMSGKTTETEDDAIKATEVRSYALFGTCVYFRIQSLFNDLKRDHHNISKPMVVLALRDLGAESDRRNSYNYWKYDLGDIRS